MTRHKIEDVKYDEPVDCSCPCHDGNCFGPCVKCGRRFIRPKPRRTNDPDPRSPDGWVEDAC